ncbi:MAG: hypothetical protein MKZ95_17475, partial [Pirellulales bacterium]|nr:hypothetical protein [Pirellulales bacterium]
SALGNASEEGSRTPIRMSDLEVASPTKQSNYTRQGGVAAARAARATRDVLRRDTASAFLAAPKRGTSLLARRLQAATQRARDAGDAGPPT